jgi:hypothetical protein
MLQRKRISRRMTVVLILMQAAIATKDDKAEADDDVDEDSIDGVQKHE